MDINSLLSPQDSAAQSAQSTSITSSLAGQPANSSNSPQKGSRRARSNSSRPVMVSSPLSKQVLASSRLNELTSVTPNPTNGLPHSAPNGSSALTNDGTPVSRQQSTPGMDALADITVVQQQRSTPAMLRSSEAYKNQLSPSPMYPNIPQVSSQSTSGARPPFEIAMPEQRETLKRDFTSPALSPEAQLQATQLDAYIQTNPHSYESHVQLIQLLHAGFVNHVYPPDTPDAHGDPRTYNLRPHLKAAREEMDRLFALGEDLWVDWLQDESMIAQTVEERIVVTELCRKATNEEYGSVRLWVIFGEWMLYLYNAAAGNVGQSQWSEEDRLVGREVFSWQSVVEVWKDGAEATQWRINDSNHVWTRYLELALQDLARNATQDRIAQVKTLFDSRLQVPHTGWDQTFQLFSTFVSTYYNANYEEIMEETVAKALDAKTKHSAREELEFRAQKATESGDRNAEYYAFMDYLQWELNRNRQKRLYSFPLLNAQYQRATLRFPTDVNLWEEYISFLTEESMNHPSGHSILPILERATRHCPWSASLWSQYLLSSEREGQSFQTIHDIKHKATSTGLLDAGGLEEVIKVHIAWCSYLRRRAFLPDSTDEDSDVAHFGIRSAIEDVQKLGEKKLGKAYQGDPQFRLERIYIRFLSETGSWDSAREFFKCLEPLRGNSYEFWLAYYSWEMVSWNKFVQGEATADAARRKPSPSYATAILKKAIERSDLDWPDRILSTYINHCEDYEDADELQLALIATRKAMKALTKKREKEQQAAAAAAAQSAIDPKDTTGEHAGMAPAKRKREDEVLDTKDSVSKRPRAEEVQSDVGTPLAQKRDRENSTIYVKNLPRDVSELKLRQFFRDCGTINSFKLLPPQDNSTSAVIEFDNYQDAEFSLSRDQRDFDGQTIEVQLGGGSTIFVTNFPPEADDAWIRTSFSDVGDIIDVRFPSLKYNTHRRFCYVQFRSAEQAQSAAKLDGKLVGDGLQLVVKISDPSRKQDRQGPMHEGREIHVSNLNWKVTEQELKDFFSKYGTVEVARIPTKVDGSSKGFGFVVFSSKEEANSALEMNEKEFHSRQLHVRPSAPVGAKRMAATIVSRVRKSPSVEPNGAVSSDEIERANGERSARTLALLGVPDTINDARIRSVVEKFGKIVKIILRPDHRGAIIEFADVNDAGRASLELEGYEISSGRRIRVGSVNDMLKQSAERKTDRIQIGQQKGKLAMMTQPPGSINRPAQPLGRGTGRRGGLGVKRGGTVGLGLSTGSKTSTNSGGASNATDTDEKTTKSNDDFRAMISGSK